MLLFAAEVAAAILKECPEYSREERLHFTRTCLKWEFKQDLYSSVLKCILMRRSADGLNISSEGCF